MKHVNGYNDNIVRGVRKAYATPMRGSWVAGIIGIWLAVLLIAAVQVVLFYPQTFYNLTDRLYKSGDTREARGARETQKMQEKQATIEKVINALRFYMKYLTDSEIQKLLKLYQAESAAPQNPPNPPNPPNPRRTNVQPFAESPDAPVVQESATRFYVQLTPEQVESYESAAFFVLRSVENDEHYNGLYTFFTSGNVELNDYGKLYANFDGRLPRLYENEEDGSQVVTSFEVERSDTHVLFNVFTILSENAGKIGMQSGMLEVKADINGNNVEVLSMTLFDEEDINPEDRSEVDIFDSWTIILAAYARLPTYGSDGRLVPYSEWERPGNMMGWEILVDSETKDNFGFVIEDLDPDFGYYLFFNIWDTHDNVTSSGAIRISLE